MLNQYNISAKLPVALLTTVLLSICAVGVAGYLSAKQQKSHVIEEKAKSSLTTMNEKLRMYLKSIEQDLKITASNRSVIEALHDFKAAWNEIGHNQTETLQSAYIEKNPYPTGEKEKLDRGNTESSYDEAHERHHTWLRKLLRTRSYYDIFLFDLDGNLLYTVFKELDYATNLNSGKYRESDLGNAFRAAADSTTPESIHFFDFKPYAPSHGAPASFMSMPIFEGDKKVGVLVFQMPIDVINKIMSINAGLGETGEIMIVGSDGLMRNNSRFTKEDDILSTRVENDAVSGALSGQFTKADADGYRNAELSYFALPFNYHGAKWALVSVRSIDELNAPIVQMRNQKIMIGLVFLTIAGVVGLLISRMIVNPISLLVQEMQELAAGNNSIAISGEDRGDEIGDIAKTLAVFKSNAIARDKLEEDTKATTAKQLERQHLMDRLIAEFREKSSQSINAVSANAEQMKSSAKSLNEIAADTSASAQNASVTSGQSANSVQSVAAAAEELSASVGEIGNQVQRANTLIDAASVEAQNTDERVAGLQSAAERIGEVIALIQDIAEQTNLLALNATIEAARAGEAGKGFAIVAHEVKELATQTARATEEISQHVTAIQGETSSSVEAIRSISHKVSEITEVTIAVGAAVEEQNATTTEISRNIHEVASGSSEIVNNVTAVASAAESTNKSADHVELTAQNVAHEAKQIRSVVEDFLSKVAAA